jgi:hypothetical protein
VCKFDRLYVIFGCLCASLTALRARLTACVRSCVFLLLVTITVKSKYNNYNRNHNNNSNISDYYSGNIIKVKTFTK